MANFYRLKANNRSTTKGHQNDVTDIDLVSFLFNLSTYFLTFPAVSINDFRKVRVCWVLSLLLTLNMYPKKFSILFYFLHHGFEKITTCCYTMSYLFLKLSSLSSTLPLVSPLFNILFTQTYRNNERNKNKKKKNENLEK